MKRKLLYFFCLTLWASLFMKAQTNDAHYVPKTPFDVSWAKSINPKYIEREPHGSVVTDEKGNVYNLISVGASRTSGNIFQAEESLPTIEPNSGTALLIKYDTNGKALWQVYFSGNIVKGYAICCDTINQKIYVAGSFDDVKPLKAFNADGKKADLQEVKTGGTSDDAFLAEIDYNGIVSKMRRIGGEDNNSLAIEIPSAIICAGNSIYMAVNNLSNGTSVNFTGETMNKKKYAASYILKVNPESFNIENVCMIRGNEEDSFDEMLISSFAQFNNQRLFVAGNTQVLDIVYTDSNKEEKTLPVKGSPNALFWGEINMESNNPLFIKVLPVNDDNGYQILNDIAVGGKIYDPESPLVAYLAGNTDGIPFEGQLLQGAFIVEWPVAEEKPSTAYLIGGENEDNTVRAIAVDRYNNTLYAAGSLTDEFDTKYTQISCEEGPANIFCALINTQTKEIEKHAYFGATGDLEDIIGLNIDEKSGKFYTTGYYSGSDFSLPNCSNVEETSPRRCNYFIAAFTADWLLTATETIASEEMAIAHATGNAITIIAEGQYSIYTIDGAVVASGISQGNAPVLMNHAGVYIVRIGNKIQKIVLQ